MATHVAPTAAEWHPGEQAMHRLLRVPARDNPTARGFLPPSTGSRIAAAPLLAVGTLDGRGRPWVAVWSGEAGFCRPVARGVLGVRVEGTDVRWDPVLGALFGGGEGAGEEDGKGRGGRQEGDGDDGVVRPEGGKVMAALAIDLETRDRVKFAGRMLAGSVARRQNGVGGLQMAVQVEEALGNCPKYLNKKHITPHLPSPRLVYEGKAAMPQWLPRKAVELIRRADLFFIASKHGGRDSMDVNHRGGAPGYLRLLRNGDDGGGGGGRGGLTLVYPEYSGNRLYQTLGNLHSDPCAGIVVPDFERGDVLYLTGSASILVGAEAAVYMPRAKLVVRIEVEEARFVEDGLGFRGEAGEMSPYNPPVRRLVGEDRGGDTDAGGGGGGGGRGDGIVTATLVRRQEITPTIARYVFRLTPSTSRVAAGAAAAQPMRAWLPGQHVTLGFAGELDAGWSHMRDDDPGSLNDDYVRTFTVSAPIDPGCVDGRGGVREGARPEVEIVVRRHGAVTALLARWNLRTPLEVPVLGFGGLEGFAMPVLREGDDEGGECVVVAGGVGITPLMAQAAAVLDGRRGKGLRVLWSLRGEDLALAVDVLQRIYGLGDVMKLFVTGHVDEKARVLVTAVQGLGAEVLERRVGEEDVLMAGGRGVARRKFYCCTGPAMMKTLLRWVEGEEVVLESFEY